MDSDEEDSQGSLSAQDVYLSETQAALWQHADLLLGLQPSRCGCLHHTRFLTYPLKKARSHQHHVVFPPYFCSGKHPHVIPPHSLFCSHSPPHSRSAIADSSPLVTVPPEIRASSLHRCRKLRRERSLSGLVEVQLGPLMSQKESQHKHPVQSLL